MALQQQYGSQQFLPSRIHDALRARGKPREAAEAGQQQKKTERGSSHPDHAPRAIKRPAQRDLCGIRRRRNRKFHVHRRRRPGACPWRSGHHPVSQRRMPFRQNHPEQRCHTGTKNPGRQHPMTKRRGSPSQHEGHAEGDHDDKHHFHRTPSFFAFATSSAILLSSSSDRRVPSPPSTAATTCAADPSKNVSTRWRNADLRAARRGTAGT